MSFGSFKSVNYTYVPKHNLEVIGQTYDYLQQRHDAAVVQESELKKQIGQLELNAQEDEFKQLLVNNVQSKIDAAMVDDFKGYVLDDIVAEAGNIMSDPRVLGRLRAQQQYKTYHANLDARTDLSEDYKNYYRQMNTYHYKDKKDAAGNIIGGTEWTPDKREVSEVPTTVIFNAAKNYISPDEGSTDSITFLDANGNPTDDYNESATGEFFTKTTTGYKAVPKEKVRAALMAAIEGTPGAKASFKQDYEIALWKDTTQGGNKDVRDANGQRMSYEEFINRRLDNFTKAISYHNYSYNIDYGTALQARQKARAAGAAADVSKQGIRDLMQANSNLELVDYNLGETMRTRITGAKEALNGIFKANGIDVDLTKADSKTIKEQIIKITDPIQRVNAEKELEAIEDAEHNYNVVRESLNADTQLKFDAFNALQSGEVLDDKNPYVNSYNKIIDRAYKENVKSNNYPLNNEEEQSYLNAIGGLENLYQMGGSIRYINGRRCVSIPRNARNNMYDILKPYDNLGLLKASTTIVEYDDGTFANELYSELNEDPGYKEHLGANMIARDRNYGGNGKALVMYMDSLEEDINNEFQIKDIPIQTRIIPVATPNEAELRTMLRSGIGDRNQINAQLQNEQDLVYNTIRNLSANQHNVRVSALEDVDEINSTDGMFKPVTTQEAMYIDGLLANKENVKGVATTFTNGKYEMVVTLQTKAKEGKQGKTLRAKISNIPDSIVKAWENNTTNKSRTDIERLRNFGETTRFANNNSFAGMPKLDVDRNLVLHNYETGNQSYLGDVDAAVLRESYMNWDNAYLYYMNGVGGMNRTNLEAIAEDTAKEYARIVYGTQNENVIIGIKNKLLNNAGL